jgi:hypothetical protein
MRYFFLFLSLMLANIVFAQDDDWMAPEGKIINYRTLNWADFLGKPREKVDDHVLAAVCPAIYYYADSGRVQANGRITFKFKVKCAFQSDAFVREATAKEHTNYYLIHEQDHYDIALTYARLLEDKLSSRDYSKGNYEAEMDKIDKDLYRSYRTTQNTYDNEVNPEGRFEKEQQYLWDMRIRKCMEENTDAFYRSPESVVKSVRGLGQTVKRLPKEPTRQFVVRVRPLYTEYPQYMVPKLVESAVWTEEKSIIAFYTQKYYVNEDGMAPKDYTRILAFMFVPNGKDTYKRVLIDTFSNNDRPVKIEAVFYAQADSDAARELVIMTTSTEKNMQLTGTTYTTKIYENLRPRVVPARLKKLDDVALRVNGGFEGTEHGKATTAKFKTQQDVTDGLKNMGYK